MEMKRTPQFTAWIDGLKDFTGRARILARIRRLGEGNPGDHRNLTGGISELRVDVGPGYRVYYTQRGNELVILLVGGDKGAQQRDIDKAKELARSL
ncbi:MULTISPECIES: type II toxin-antitoxin system RelE/ParE family toxin [Stenotrophomonas]|jgi:putative addiction module killer protein|uniref:type II toxin-antitoxin system RelE/ParE family toxin n=1 Tax=Stenotrophomonas TaxID=40323 RepID=UPI000E5B4C55|nr:MULTISPECIES: type II toxin-antitoxin system RelE/ParE family toxin [Stenotrophomonas]MBD3680488.1 type II toxin-antitoxin system RelE/ParE family toxin [Stenotrophomonas sp. Br8]RIA33529.1 putative addiction module killer protein [Stenotrophomonas sp. AG209]